MTHQCLLVYFHLAHDYDALDGDGHVLHDCLVLDCRDVRGVLDGPSLQMTIGNIWVR